MLCNHDCDKCKAYDGNAFPVFCKVMNAEIAASNAKKEYYQQRSLNNE